MAKNHTLHFRCVVFLYMWFLKVLLHLACCKFSNTPISSFHAQKKHPIGCFVGADADSVQSWHSQRRLRANYPSLNKHLRLSHQYILLYAILIIARIHATFVASSLSATALGVLQVFQHSNLVLPYSKKTPYWVFYWSGCGFGAELT